jgi:beta-phosphoglucomutase
MTDPTEYPLFPATLFDFNGVLVDDELVHLEAFRDAVKPLGLIITDQEYWDEYLGFDDVGAFTAILNKAGLDSSRSRVVELVEAKRPLYMKRAKLSLALTGLVGIVSGALHDEIAFGLQHLGVAEVVGHIIAAEDTAASKPDPEGYQLGIEWLIQSLSLEKAQQALVIEDSLDGIAAAKAAGLPVIAVAHSYGRRELDESGADLVLENISQIDDAQLLHLYQKLYG